ncbi:hypothetical protein PISL3812_05418 [Talaromyces islandicus]|uniref:Uncharacterized protein n=1 Tax=Talaromyces islandicus TaxID=28573 RepID=A0A0U1LYG4_TALIS|nr:hypothetical protein PISL3812_05418 [Talaromyces islandicus]
MRALSDQQMNLSSLMGQQSDRHVHLDFPVGQVVCLHGQYRLRAGNEFLVSYERWWTVDLYLNDMSSELQMELADKYSNEAQPNDGEVYRKMPYAAQKGKRQVKAKSQDGDQRAIHRMAVLASQLGFASPQILQMTQQLPDCQLALIATVGKIKGTIGKRSDGGSGKNEKYAKVRGGNGSGNGGSRDSFAVSEDEIVERLEKDLLLELSWWTKTE